MNWLKARLAEPSTWSGISHLSVVLALLFLTWTGNWRIFAWAAAITAVVSIVLKEKGQA